MESKCLGAILHLCMFEDRFLFDIANIQENCTYLHLRDIGNKEFAFSTVGC